MSREEVFNGVVEIFQDVFDEPELEVLESSNSSNIYDWDSLNHINLVCAIEQEFDIKFTLDELTSLKDVGAMLDLMMQKIHKRE